MRDIEADWATSGDEAIEKVASKSYDLAVLDMKMPKMNGLELKDQLQKRSPQLRFIFLTGYVSEMDFEQVACQAGKACYLVKPVDINLLIERMNDLMGHPEGES